MRKTFVLGLTGSIGMGKSTVCGFFRDEGVPVWDADETVHRIYAKNGAGVKPISQLYPKAVTNGEVNRAALKSWIKTDPTALAKIEAVIHPIVKEDRTEFLKAANEDGANLVVFDIPLLYETGGEKEVDAVAVVTAPKEVQRTRVLARPGMTEDVFKMLLEKQIPDEKKRALADFVIQSIDMEETRQTVRALIAQIKLRKTHA